MINITLLWLLLVPVFLAAVVFMTVEHVMDIRVLSGKIWAAGLTFGACLAITLVTFSLLIGEQTADVEIWNGKTVSKQRVEGEYQRPYECMCRDECRGIGQNRTCTRVCQTCYEQHYTVHWYCDTTLGRYTIHSVDETTRRVYDYPDPDRWVSIKPDEPVAKAMPYTNYIQAVPNSLFTPAAADLKAKFAHMLPKYPDSPYDIYRLDRFIPVGVPVPEIPQWNWDLGVMLNDLGPAKQVNVIIVVVNTADPNYEYALRDAWDNGNKNDVIVVMGMTQYPKIEWVRIITWSKSEIFKVQLRDRLLDLGTIENRAQVLQTISSEISSTYVRRRMREFAYLKGEIDLPVWVTWTLVVGQCIVVLGTLGFLRWWGTRHPSAHSI
jgi:hypothetical protein